MSNFHNACHAKCRLLSPRATTPTQNEGRCQQVPCLRRKTNMDVATCHACHTKAACHTKCGGAKGDQPDPSVRPEPTQCCKCHACHAKQRPMSPIATPTVHKTNMDVAKCMPGGGGECGQMPRPGEEEEEEGSYLACGGEMRRSLVAVRLFIWFIF